MVSSPPQGKNMIDIRQSKNYANYLSSQGWIVERINDINYFIKKIPIIGSVLKIQRPLEIRYKDIKILSEKYNAFQIIVEPIDQEQSTSLMQHGYKPSKSTYLPSKTIHIDLTQTKDQIFKSFNKDCRYAIRKSSFAKSYGRTMGENITIREYSSPKEIEIWHTAWKRSVNFMRFVPSLDDLLKFKKSFPQSHSIFLASHNISGNIIGGALFTRSLHDFGYYWYGFTDKEGRTSLSQYPLLYQGILWAKKRGCKIFDMEGIYDSRFPNKSWLGFTHFKKSFGGTEVSYPGCYSRFRIYNLFRFWK